MKAVMRWDVHPELGIDGWVLDKFKSWVWPTNGRGIAHDLVEHFPDAKGSLTDELQAFGAMCYVRQGHLDGMFYTGGASIAMEIPAVWRDSQEFNSGDPLPEISHQLPADLHRVMSRAKAKWMTGMFEDDRQEMLDSLELPPLEVWLRCQGWIVKGWRRAQKRYGGVYGSAPKALFDEIERVIAVQTKHRDFESELVLNYGFRDSGVPFAKANLIYHD